jgi:hypothetical protein
LADELAFGIIERLSGRAVGVNGLGRAAGEIGIGFDPFGSRRLTAGIPADGDFLRKDPVGINAVFVLEQKGSGRFLLVFVTF